MKKHHLYLPLFVLLMGTLLQNCQCGRLCSNAMPEVNFVNFDSTDLNVVILREYNKDGTFTKLTATSAYTNKAMPGPDTQQIMNNVIYVDSYHDYTVEVPSASKVWHIKNIGLHYEKMKSTTCTGGMTYYINDSLKVIPTNTLASDQPGLINVYK